jgi:hypothetical protein
MKIMGLEPFAVIAAADAVAVLGFAGLFLLWLRVNEPCL